MFPRFEIVRFEVEARLSTRNAEVEAKLRMERYDVVACVEVAYIEVSFAIVELAVNGVRSPTTDDVGVRYLPLSIVVESGTVYVKSEAAPPPPVASVPQENFPEVGLYITLSVPSATQFVEKLLWKNPLSTCKREVEAFEDTVR